MKEEHVFVVDGIKTLPLMLLHGRLVEDLEAFGKAQVKTEIGPIDYSPLTYCIDNKWLDIINKDVKEVLQIVQDLFTHKANYLYYVQFRDDKGGEKSKALYSHIELISFICEARLEIDPTFLFSQFFEYVDFKFVHSDYRQDENRNSKYEEYVQRIDKVWSKISARSKDTILLIQRIIRQIEVKSHSWNTLPALCVSHKDNNLLDDRSRVRLFYSYSHKDETLRDQLETHLSLLKRRGIIEEWHDRKISAGKEWEQAINNNILSAQIILLLVSADFIASDYCYGKEMEYAMKRHSQGVTRVIPVILRACDWTCAQFGKLQALPKDAKPITSWGNHDEAFTDVSKGIRKAIEELL